MNCLCASWRMPFFCGTASARRNRAAGRCGAACQGRSAWRRHTDRGVDKLMTLLARCCKPVPPDPVIGFVTKGRGISIHRRDCSTLKRLAEASPERLITADWGKVTGNTFATDIMIEAHDRPSLLRDLSDIMAREKNQRHRRQYAVARYPGAHAFYRGNPRRGRSAAHLCPAE